MVFFSQLAVDKHANISHEANWFDFCDPQFDFVQDLMSPRIINGTACGAIVEKIAEIF